jgi:hypothetical protein
MKTLIAKALIATAGFVGTAHAMTTPTVNSEAQFILPGADFSGLSASQVAHINNTLTSDASNGEKRAVISSFLR